MQAKLKSNRLFKSKHLYTTHHADHTPQYSERIRLAEKVTTAIHHQREMRAHHQKNKLADSIDSVASDLLRT